MVVDPWTDLVVLVLVEQQEGVLEQEETFTDKEQELVDNREDTAGRWGDQVGKTASLHLLLILYSFRQVNLF